MKSNPNYRLASKALILRMRDEYGLEHFVETGTLHGRLTQWAATQFKQVYTIELSEVHHTRTKNRLKDIPNIHWFLGNSGDVISTVLKLLPAPSLL